MGYYDENYESENGRKRKQKGNRSGILIASLVGVIIGALIVLFVFPQLGLIEDQQGAISNDTNSNGETVQKIKQSVSMDVTTAVTDAVDKAGDAVVGITNIQQTSNFWGQNGPSGSSPGEAGTGSGVVYKKENGKAYIVTNHHVIENANELEVTLADGTKLSAEIKGSDVWTDLAVIEVDADKVKTVAEFGDSEALKPGEPVIAIGNPLGLQFSGSVTQGIISGLERAIEIDINEDGLVDWNAEVLQTDAAINPGNSGGALVNLKGQVIGINSMKIAESAVEGIGLSIPINSANPIIADLETHGEVKRPYMGVSLASVEEVSQYHQQNTLKLPSGVTAGVAITGVEANSPAGKAGLKEFDVIVEMDGEKISNVVELRQYLYTDKKIGDDIRVKYYRNGKAEETTMKLTNASL